MDIPLEGEDFENFNAGNGKKNRDLSIFGFDIQQFSSGLKYSLGFTFIGLIIIAVIYAMRKIKSFDRPIKNKKDKKKN